MKAETVDELFRVPLMLCEYDLSRTLRHCQLLTGGDK